MSRKGNKFACAITGLESHYTAYVTQGTVLSKQKENCSTAVNKYCFIMIGQWWPTMKTPLRKTKFTARLTVIYEFHRYRIKCENENSALNLIEGSD